MREILFRGKRLDNGEWVYGNLVRYANGDAEIWEIFNPDIYTDCRDWVIIPETVGQYTGLQDRDGIKIFEGDVLGKLGHWSFYVGFKDANFVMVPCNQVQRVNHEWHSLGQEKVSSWAIIGNLYDNPELLEVE